MALLHNDKQTLDTGISTALYNTHKKTVAANSRSKKLPELPEPGAAQRTNALKAGMRELKRSLHELQQINLFQKNLLNSAGAIIISVAKNGIIESFNPEAERELGYRADEVIGKYTPLIFHDPLLIKKKKESLSKELKKDIRDDIDLFFEKARLNIQDEGEWSYVRKDGTQFPVRLNITAIKNEQGLVTGFMGIAFDISDAKKTEDDLNLALQKEKDLSELKSRFVTMASHEFRTPLSTVLSSAYLIEKYAAAEDQLKRKIHLQRIVSSVSMLTDILNDFLSVGKIEEGKITVRPVHFNICNLVAEVIEGVENTLKTAQQIQYEHEGKDEVFLDPSLLKHIIMNLVSNAIKFSAEKSLVQIRSHCTDQQIKISVRDHGIGISKADQEHLMERFFRGANAGNIQGTGLGLHLVAKYAELLNGKVACSSELEKGTEFVVTFTTQTSGYEKDTVD